MLGQIITGTALACKSPTPGIRMLAIAYGIAMAYEPWLIISRSGGRKMLISFRSFLFLLGKLDVSS